MREYVARLINCGFPRELAVWLCCHYRKEGGTRAVERYVEAVEAECNEMDIL